jgi:tryptophan halogenase
MSALIGQTAQAMPDHQAFIARYCAADAAPRSSRMTDQRLRKIVIVGGGTAGWMTAAALGRFLKDGHTQVTLVESEEIGTVGVGESTIPQINIFNRMLGLDENEFVRRTKATFKLAIDFVDWKQIGHSYYHPFGPYGVDMEGVSFHAYWLRLKAMGEAADLTEYSLQALASAQGKFMRANGQRNSPLGTIAHAYHIDAGLYAQFLRGYAEERGVRRQEGKIVEVHQRAEDGFVEAVTLQSGQRVEGDLFIDCSGFRGLLIEQTLKTGFEDWSHWLLNDRAVAVPCELGGSRQPVTRATARPAGWQWRIPLQHRLGNGYAYSSEHISEDEATAYLLANLDGAPLRDPIHPALQGRPAQEELEQERRGHRPVGRLHGAAGEPEHPPDPGGHLAPAGHVPRQAVREPDIDRYNRVMQFEYEKIRDFLILHFHATQRNDTPTGTICGDADPGLPGRQDGGVQKLRPVFRENEELFNDTSWFAVMIGQGLEPRGHDPMADVMSADELRAKMANIRAVIAKSAEVMPDHTDAFIAANCAAIMSQGPHDLPWTEYVATLQPHERPTLPGSPATPDHAPLLRARYALTGVLVSLTGGLGAAVISANLPSLAGDLGVSTTEVAWLPIVFVMTNACMNLLLIKFRQQYGLQLFTKLTLAVFVAVTLAHLFINGFGSIIAVRAVAGICAAGMSSLGILYMIQAFPAVHRLKGLVIGIGLASFTAPMARIFSNPLIELTGWQGVYLFEAGLALLSLAAVLSLKLPPSQRLRVFEPLDFLTFVLFAPGVALLCAVLAPGPHRLVDRGAVDRLGARRAIVLLTAAMWSSTIAPAR